MLLEDKDPPSFASRKRNRLLFLLAWAFVSGLIYGVVDADWEMPILILDAFVFVVVIVQWVHLDAADFEFQLWRHFVLHMVVCPGPLFVMPVYFIKTRGWGKGLIACGYALAFLLLEDGIDIAATYLGLQLAWGD